MDKYVLFFYYVNTLSLRNGRGRVRKSLRETCLLTESTITVVTKKDRFQITIKI